MKNSISGHSLIITDAVNVPCPFFGKKKEFYFETILISLFINVTPIPETLHLNWFLKRLSIPESIIAIVTFLIFLIKAIVISSCSNNESITIAPSLL